MYKIGELTDKPGSVVDSHSSGTNVAVCLKQPTRSQRGTRHMETYLVLLRVGFTMPLLLPASAVRSYRTLSPLPVFANESSAVYSLLHWP